MASSVKYVASVTTVADSKERGGGRFAYARAEGVGVVTFALVPDVWEESENPEPGDEVVISELRCRHGKWRAKKARFLQPGDEK